jgi:hypothetical protein
MEIISKNTLIDASNDAREVEMKKALDEFADKSLHNHVVRIAYDEACEEATRASITELAMGLALIDKLIAQENELHLLQIENAKLTAKLAKICEIVS